MVCILVTVFFLKILTLQKRVEKSGFDFVGPPASVIRMMGNKISAKEFALKAGLPIVPGSTGPIDQDTHKKAEEIGYPVIIKAASGGGGRGMRIVHSAEELDDAIELTQQESAAAFGDSTVYLEKFLESPRHIEVQVLADRHGNVFIWETEIVPCKEDIKRL